MKTHNIQINLFCIFVNNQISIERKSLYSLNFSAHEGVKPVKLRHADKSFREPFTFGENAVALQQALLIPAGGCDGTCNSGYGGVES